MQWVTLRGNDRLGNFLTAAPSPLSFLSSATRDGKWFLSRKCLHVCDTSMPFTRGVFKSAERNAHVAAARRIPLSLNFVYRLSGSVDS
jgi:hypothetical protein